MLSNGKVLIAGGSNSAGYLTSAELYDPSTGTFTFTGSMHTPRASHSATALTNGEVLLAAGENSSSNGGYVGSAELYNPSTGKFVTTGSLNTPRFLHTAHLLAAGQVLIVAGNHFGSIASAELYDPSTGTFRTTASLNTPRQGHVSALLLNGRVFAAGGYESQTRAWLASAELYR
jgi:hypothetical protein